MLRTSITIAIVVVSVAFNDLAPTGRGAEQAVYAGVMAPPGTLSEMPPLEAVLDSHEWQTCAMD
jgi:hypothetical protein